MERHCFQQLPDGYEKTLTLDLQKDTKLALVVNGLAVGIAAVMLAAGFLLMPVFTISASRRWRRFWSAPCCIWCSMNWCTAPA